MQMPLSRYPNRDDILKARSLEKCAVVGSGHSLRCGEAWGSVIDSPYYTAVFRSNLAATPGFGCRTGTRTDFMVNYPGPPHSVFIPKKVRADGTAFAESYTSLRTHLRRNNKRRFPVLVPSAAGLSRGAGAGTGTSALAFAISLCEHIDIYGYGAFADEADIKYAHFYDRTPFNWGHLIFESDLRNAIFSALGIWNNIWW